MQSQLSNKGTEDFVSVKSHTKGIGSMDGR